MTDEKLLDAFVESLDTNAWNSMKSYERLDLLQKYENTMAALQHRPACKVIPIPDAEDHPGLLGYYNNAKNVIAINKRYLTSKMKIAGVAQFILPNALQTIAHEGRHAWQHYLVAHPELNLVDEDTRLAIMMNFENYEGGAPLYSGQLIEMDARLYAQEVLEKISMKLKQGGRADYSFERAVLKAKQGEVIRALELLKHKDAEAVILKREKLAREFSKKLHPDQNFDNVSFFKDILKVIKSGDINKLSDAKPIKIREVEWTEKVDKPLEKADELKIHIREKNKFL